MEHSIAPCLRSLPAVRDVAPDPTLSSSVRCAFLSVAYVACLADVRQERVRNDIEIIIPGENAAFRGTYRTADDTFQTVLVHGHHVTVIPARQSHTIQSARSGNGPRPSDAVVISLDPWTVRREPFLLETSRPGIFAAGDVRSGSVKRFASCVGEGAMAVQFVHEYLKET